MEFLNCTKGCFKWQVTQKYVKVLRFGSFAFFTTDLIFKALKKLFFSFKPSQIQPALSRFKSTNTNLTHSQRLSLVCNYAHNCWQSKYTTTTVNFVLTA